MRTSRNLAQTLRRLADRLDHPDFDLVYDNNRPMRPTISMAFGSNISGFKAAVKAFQTPEYEVTNFIVSAFRDDEELAVVITGHADHLSHMVKHSQIVERRELDDDVKAILAEITPVPLDK